MKGIISLIGAVAPCAGAIVNRAPSATDAAAVAADLRGVSPKPTDSPLHPDLARRAAASQSLLGWFAPDNTCGYVHGTLGASKTCDNTQRCAAVQIEGIATMGCCDTNDESCTWYGNCVGYVGYYSSSLCDHLCEQDINTVKCTNSLYPYCYSYMIPGISAGWFSCDSTYAATFDSFLTTFAGETDQRTWNEVYDTDSATSLLPTATLTGSAGFTAIPYSGSATSSRSSTTSSEAKSSPSSSGGSKTPIGAIVGGLVGGLAVIGAIVGVVVFFLLRKKSGSQNNTPATGAAAATAGGPGPGGSGPHMSQQGPGMYQQPVQYQPPSQGQYEPNYPNGTYFALAKADAPYGQDPKSSQAAGATITEQSGDISPQPPTSPAPPYSQPVHEIGVGRQTSRPPPHNMLPAFQNSQQPGYQPQHQAPAELGVTYAVPTRHEGRPVYEAA